MKKKLKMTFMLVVISCTGLYAQNDPNLTGNYNIGIGPHTGTNITEGNDNTLIGNTAGTNITEGNDNILIGRNAGYDVETGSNNVFIGPSSGNNAGETGSDNIAIGRGASLPNLFQNDLYNQNNRLVIGNMIRGININSSTYGTIGIGQPLNWNMQNTNKTTINNVVLDINGNLRMRGTSMQTIKEKNVVTSIDEHGNAEWRPPYSGSQDTGRIIVGDGTGGMEASDITIQELLTRIEIL